MAYSSAIAPASPPPNLPSPRGDLCDTPVDDFAAVMDRCYPRAASTMDKRKRAVGRFTSALLAHPGATWQERWSGSGWDAHPADLRTLEPPGRPWSIAVGFKVLAVCRAIVPSLPVLRELGSPDYALMFRVVQNDPLLDEAMERIAVARASVRHRQMAAIELCYLLTTQAIPFSDITPAGLLHFAGQFRAAGTSQNPMDTPLPGTLLWQVLTEIRQFPPDVPHSLRAARAGGRKSVTELVDAFSVCDPAVRQLLIDYINHRSAAGLDYSSVCNLARNLVRNFWCHIERINPAQTDLILSSGTYEKWREAIDTVPGVDGSRPRKGIWEILLAVKAFYLDIQSWAAEDPARWGPWVARCPIPATTRQAYARDRRRLTERMADRTRLRQPLLPLLTDWVTRENDHYRDLSDAAAHAETGMTLTIGGRQYTVLPRPDPKRLNQGSRYRKALTPRRVKDAATGKVFVPTRKAEHAFWRWAVVEVLRLTGLRQEEMLELSHLSVRQYKRPNGEVVALLVVSPSKSDRERVIPMSAELFHVIAELIRHQTADGRAVPNVRRWDPYEREHTAPMPYLFQHQTGPTRMVFSPAWAIDQLQAACAELAREHPEFAGAKFTPHDFRRLFATDLVNNGLPIHIGAALLGHTNLQTTRGYVAVFDEDVVTHYQQHLARRRAVRPAEEYRPVTDQEWSEFGEHFEKRKVELGGCGRPYGTPCNHEHACIRCPMLQINPKMLPRLADLEQDLLTRRGRAEAEGWLGEIDGIDLTLTFLRDKRAQAERLAAHRPVLLGLPNMRRPMAMPAQFQPVVD